MRYNQTQKIFQYCDNTNWNRVGDAGSGSGGCSTPTCSDGKIVYNQDYGILQGCAGQGWRVYGGVRVGWGFRGWVVGMVGLRVKGKKGC